MKLHKKIVYYKKIRRGKEPCKYVARQPRGENTDVYATIKLDPILRKKKLKKIKNGMMKHEIVEITRWGKGDRYSHRDAEKAEPAITRKKVRNVSLFWKYCKDNNIG
jgi:predicted SprT family Zn-dependent metalloprotease